MKAILLISIVLVHSVAAAPLAAPIPEVRDLAERADAVKKPVPDWVYYGAGAKTPATPAKRDAHPAPEAADAVKKSVPDWVYYGARAKTPTAA